MRSLAGCLAASGSNWPSRPGGVPQGGAFSAIAWRVCLGADPGCSGIHGVAGGALLGAVDCETYLPSLLGVVAGRGVATGPLAFQLALDVLRELEATCSKEAVQAATDPANGRLHAAAGLKALSRRALTTLDWVGQLEDGAGCMLTWPANGRGLA